MNLLRKLFKKKEKKSTFEFNFSAITPEDILRVVRKKAPSTSRVSNELFSEFPVNQEEKLIKKETKMEILGGFSHVFAYGHRFIPFSLAIRTYETAYSPKSLYCISSVYSDEKAIATAEDEEELEKVQYEWEEKIKEFQNTKEGAINTFTYKGRTIEVLQVTGMRAPLLKEWSNGHVVASLVLEHSVRSPTGIYWRIFITPEDRKDGEDREGIVIPGDYIVKDGPDFYSLQGPRPFLTSRKEMDDDLLEKVLVYYKSKDKEKKE